MKTSWVLLAGLLLATSCATVQQNVDARTFLAQCQYEFVDVQVKDVTFSSGVLIDQVRLVVRLKITNPTKKDVALDHAQLGVLLDKNPVLDLAHTRFTRVAAGSSQTDGVEVVVPWSGIVKTLGHRPEVLGIDAKLWVSLLVGASTWETPIVVPLKAEFRIPYDQVDRLVAEQQRKLEAEARDKAAEAARSVLPPTPSLKF